VKFLGLSETVSDTHAVDFSGVSAVSGRATIQECPVVLFLVWHTINGTIKFLLPIF
jgi:hypothetical protein